ncbi:MAG: hypothetical protein ACO4AD_09065 [Pseudomonadales bacterium]
MATNDPAGFNFIDVMAWGALGHAQGWCLGSAIPCHRVSPALLLSSLRVPMP